MKNRLLPTTQPVYDPVAPGEPNAADINPAEFLRTVTRGLRRAIARPLRELATAGT
jgi:hypothetical protein